MSTIVKVFSVPNARRKNDSRHRYVGQSRVIRMRDLSRSDRSAGRLRLKRWRVLDLSSFFALRLFFSYSKEWQQADASTSVGWRNFDLSEYFFFKYLETTSSNRAFSLMKTQNSSPLFSLNFCPKCAVWIVFPHFPVVLHFILYLFLLRFPRLCFQNAFILPSPHFEIEGWETFCWRAHSFTENRLSLLLKTRRVFKWVVWKVGFK